MMPLVGPPGQGCSDPRGMMPNPKVGTVTPDVAAAVKASKGGAVEFPRREGRYHSRRRWQRSRSTPRRWKRNVRAFADAVVKARPAGAKGIYVQKVAITFRTSGAWHQGRPVQAFRLRAESLPGGNPACNSGPFGARMTGRKLPIILSETAGGAAQATP